MVLCAWNDCWVAFVDPQDDAAISGFVACAEFEGESATENAVGKKKILDKAFFPELNKTDDSLGSNGVAPYNSISLTAGSGNCVTGSGLAETQVSKDGFNIFPHSWPSFVLTESA